MVNFENKDHYNVYDLKSSSPCCGDRAVALDAEQTHESIRRNFLEEA